MPVNQTTTTVNIDYEAVGFFVTLIIIAIIILIIILAVKGKSITQKENYNDGLSPDDIQTKHVEDENNKPQNAESSVQKKKPNKLLGVSIALSILILSLPIFAVINNSNNNRTNNYIVKTLEQPEISFTQTLSGINFNIIAKDNYSELVIEYKLLNSKSKTITTGVIEKNNLKKGNTYTITRSFSLEELLKCTHVSCTVTKCV